MRDDIRRWEIKPVLIPLRINSAERRLPLGVRRAITKIVLSYEYIWRARGDRRRHKIKKPALPLASWILPDNAGHKIYDR